LNVTNYYKQNDSILEHQEYKTVHKLLKVKKPWTTKLYEDYREKHFWIY